MVSPAKSVLRTKKHLDISHADEASTGWVGIKAEL